MENLNYLSTSAQEAEAESLEWSTDLSGRERKKSPAEHPVVLPFRKSKFRVIPGRLGVPALPSQSIGYRIGKRALDLVLGILIFPFVAALGALIALSIALTSGGPVFYSQDRIGRYGRTFRIFKFRTMHSRAEQLFFQYLDENPGAYAEWLHTHKLRCDPRVTCLGRFLRKTSLDELPQIINVLRGEMSFVGPRPIVQAEKEKYQDQFIYYTAVLPGITGLWQVSGRCDVSYGERVGFDSHYARNWNLFLDLKILLRTPRAVLRGGGAY